MREIIFRGKRTKTGEWAFGLLYAYSEIAACIYSDELDKPVWVHPETVGQFTGLTDKNGKRIFEGDIVQYIETDQSGNLICTGSVEFTEGSFSPIPTSYSCGDDYSYELHSFEIIGNIIDNPELLETA